MPLSCVVFVLFFFLQQKTAYEMLRSLVGSEMCIRDRSVGKIRVPVVVRLQGTNAQEAREIINNSGLSVIAATSFGEAAEAVGKVLRSVQGV